MSEQTPHIPTQNSYWLTMLEVQEGSMHHLRTLDAMDSFAASITESNPDPTGEARVFTDEAGRLAYVAIHAWGANRQQALHESLSATWQGLERASLYGRVFFTEARIVPSEAVGESNVEDTWHFMEPVEPEDFIAATEAVMWERELSKNSNETA